MEKIQEEAEKTTAELVRQDEATEELITTVQRQLLEEQLKAQASLAAALAEQQVAVDGALRTATRDGKRELQALRTRLDAVPQPQQSAPVTR